MFYLSKIKKELNQIFKKSFVSSEIDRLKKELSEFEVYKKIKKPTQKHLQDLEKKYRNFSSKITKKQSKIDKDFKKALDFVKKGKISAETHIQSLQKTALEKKNSIEKIFKDQMEILGLKGKTKAKARKKTTTRAKKKKTRTKRKKVN